MEISGKLALVTGGTDGIGLELARHLKREGATVVVAGRDPGRLDAARAEGFEAVATDLATAGGCDALIAAIAGRPLDILINNAGMGADWDVAKPIDIAAAEQCLFLNVTAPVRLIDGLIGGLRARPSAMIVNITSGLAIAPSAKNPIYCGTKAALRSITQSLRGQLKGSTVHVLEALPPVVETRMTEGNPHKKLPAAECARQIVAAMRADRDEAYVGMTRWLRLAHGISPALAQRIMLNY